MAGSEGDMFEDSNMSQGKKKVSSTYQPENKSISYMYDCAILFDWDVDVESPFSFHDVSRFTEKEMKPLWFSKNFGVNSRLTQLRNLSPFPGRVVSLFGKIEIGATDKEKKDIVKNLNMKYRDLATKCGSEVKTCLKKLAEDTAYRHLSLFSVKSAAVEKEVWNKVKKTTKKKWTSSSSCSSSSASDVSSSILKRTKYVYSSVQSGTKTVADVGDGAAASAGVAEGGGDDDTVAAAPAAGAGVAPAASAGVAEGGGDDDTVGAASAGVAPAASAGVAEGGGDDNAAASAACTADSDAASASAPVVNDPSPWEKEFIQFPSHSIFFQKLRNAQGQCNLSKKRAQICWRGHRTSVGPKDGGMSKIEMMKRLVSALKNIRSITEAEKEVYFIINKVFLICYL